jgi:hypothetical protein
MYDLPNLKNKRFSPEFLRQKQIKSYLAKMAVFWVEKFCRFQDGGCKDL